VNTYQTANDEVARIMTATRPRRTAEAPERPGRIGSVESGTLAHEIGLQSGDQIHSVNGNPLDDALDFQYLADDEVVTLVVERGTEMLEYEIERESWEPWGITFADPTFDGIHLCENACPFCFIKQLPKGMRKSLYVMDDDYRYSMMYGNFVTLTNLTEADWQRIEQQRISPINVSVHATDPDLRVALVGNPKAAQIMDHLARLERAGIEYNTQVVLCPGVNDGAQLDRTIRDLLDSGPHMKSIAIVPVGLSKYGIERQSKRVRLSRTCMRSMPNADKNLLEMRRHTPEEAMSVIGQVHSWQEGLRKERERTVVYLGDEFYLMTGSPVPPARNYDGFPQVEDGIGITRLFLDDATRVIRQKRGRSLTGLGGTIVCGTLIDETMRETVDRVNRAFRTDLRVISAENNVFGPQINVSGLLTGAIVRDAVAHERSNQPVFISETMISRRTQTFLDDMTIDELERALARQVIPAENIGQVLKTLEQPAVSIA
jgi:putative radical SAM enzyme (TIGR03279 family)